MGVMRTASLYLYVAREENLWSTAETSLRVLKCVCKRVRHGLWRMVEEWICHCSCFITDSQLLGQIPQRPSKKRELLTPASGRTQALPGPACPPAPHPRLHSQPQLPSLTVACERANIPRSPGPARPNPPRRHPGVPPPLWPRFHCSECRPGSRRPGLKLCSLPQVEGFSAPAGTGFNSVVLLEGGIVPK